MRMQVILDSLFARSGSAPIGGGKKGEFRDWTILRHAATGKFSGGITVVSPQLKVSFHPNSKSCFAPTKSNCPIFLCFRTKQ